MNSKEEKGRENQQFYCSSSSYQIPLALASL